MGRGICSKIIKINAIMVNRAVLKIVRAIISRATVITVVRAKIKTEASRAIVIIVVRAKAKTVANRAIAIIAKAVAMITNVRVVFSLVPRANSPVRLCTVKAAA